MHVLGKMSLQKHSHQKFPKGIIHRAKSSVSSTTPVFIWLCVSDNLLISYQNHQNRQPVIAILDLFTSNFQKQLQQFLVRNNLPREVECLQYNNRLHMTVCFINFSRHSFTVDRAHGTGLIILAQNNSQLCNTLTVEFTFHSRHNMFSVEHGQLMNSNQGWRNTMGSWVLALTSVR